MKMLLSTALLAAAAATAFAQGKVNLINDAASLIVLSTTSSFLNPADISLAGLPVGNLVTLPSGATLVAGLYGSTSSSSLFLYSTVALNNQAMPGGYIPGTQIQLTAQANGAPLINGIANGTPIGASTPWFQVKVWDASFATYELASGHYRGAGPEFQFNPGPSLSYPNTAPPGVNSTWTERNIVLTWFVPEPSATALLGLGLASLLVFRRRK